MLFSYQDWPRWAIYTCIASMLSIMGTLMVPICAALFDNSRSINSKMLNYGLSLSSGSMMCTSLLKMLGSTDSSNSVIVFLGFSCGCVLSFVLNHIVHVYTSESLVHCSHSGGGDAFSVDSHQSGFAGHDMLHRHEPRHSHENHISIRNHHSFEGEDAHHHENENENEREHEHGHIYATCCDSSRENHYKLMGSNDESEPLLVYTTKYSGSSQSENRPSECIPLARATSIGSLPIAKCLLESKPPMACVETNIGYDLENLAVYREHFMKKMDRSQDVMSTIPSLHNGEDHTHQLETPFSKLLSIGLQTCVVICLHKFPEGFIIFYTNNVDKIEDGGTDLGFSIFLSLTIHNFIEGFSMTLPLYTALKKKWHGILTAALFGGCSQPLGAVLGMEWYKHFGSDIPNEDINQKIDFLLSLTAGFLFVISLQMFQTAVAFSDSHHHHEGEDESQIHAQHSAGVTCLRFCCLGVLLVLASSALKKLG